MITFLKLKAEGFCSISSIDLPLNYNGTILIKAANGFGKSSIFSALVWCLYGKNLKGVSDVTTWEKVRPKDYKGVKVEVFFQNNDKLFRVIRCQDYTDTLDDGAKGKNRLLIYEDSVLLDTKGKNKLQEDLERAVGFSYNLFMNSIMFGQGLKRLIQESNPDKKKIFEEIFDLSFINEAKSIAQGIRSNIQDETLDLKHKVSSYEREYETLKDTYEDLLHKEKEDEEELLGIRKKLKAKKKELTSKIEVLNYDNEAYKQVLEDITKLKSKKSKVKSHLDTPLEELINKLYSLILNKQNKEALSVVTKLKEAFDSIHTIDEKLEQLQDSLTKLQAQKVEYSTCLSKLKDIEDDLKTCKSELDELHSKDTNKLSNKYKDKLKHLKKELRSIQATLDERTHTLDDYNWVIDDPLGNNGIKAYLFDSSLDLINSTLDKYATHLGFRIEFNVDLESARKDFVTLIEKDGCIIDYDELSGGEKQLCNIAMAFAMNEVLTASRGINLAFLDEVFESLSQDNIEIVISLIRNVFEDKTLFLITHHDSLPLSNSKILQVHKVNGLSSYEVL